MHVAFIPYGGRFEVETLLRNIESQKFYLPMWKGKKKQSMPVGGQIRELPFGVKEAIFPKEYQDLVLSTFSSIPGNDYSENYIKGYQKKLIRKALKLKKIPKYDNSKKFLWNTDNMGIIVLGVRYDKDVTDQTGEMKGWTHEGF